MFYVFGCLVVGFFVCICVGFLGGWVFCLFCVLLFVLFFFVFVVVVVLLLFFWGGSSLMDHISFELFCIYSFFSVCISYLIYVGSPTVAKIVHV